MPQIPLKTIADTGLSVSAVGLGTVKFGRNQAVKYPANFQLPDDSQLIHLLTQAQQAGINLLDTAPAYGIAQQRLGRLIGNDHSWVISTKVGESFAAGKSTYSYTADATRRTVHNSLRELNRETLDIVLIHSDGNDLHILQHTEVMPTLLQLRDEGKIRATGISSKTVEGGLFALQHLDIVMCTYNLTATGARPVIEKAATTGRGILIKKGLMSGHLHTAAHADPLQASYNHIFSQPGVSSLIIGTINPQHLQQNIKAFTSMSPATT